MKDLIERLEKATRPDRTLDWGIHCRNGREGVGAYGPHPKYTESIDAAVTLVPEGLSWALWGDDNQARVYERLPEGTIEMGRSWEHHDAATPAIALCIAALKARAAVSVTPT